MSLDLMPLQHAVTQLAGALETHDSELASTYPHLKQYLRAASIQAFEFTYELSFKMIKRYIRVNSANPSEIDRLSFNDVMREAYRQGLVQSELRVWRVYRRYRGTTSHAYDERKAQLVFEAAPEFLREARYLLERLQERHE
jgi:nucleotidyltransferase substrate binding protein (TIGR01987 family)